jgi:hypothetical protein
VLFRRALKLGLTDAPGLTTSFKVLSSVLTTGSVSALVVSEVFALIENMRLLLRRQFQAGSIPLASIAVICSGAQINFCPQNQEFSEAQLLNVGRLVEAGVVSQKR